MKVEVKHNSPVEIDCAPDKEKTETIDITTPGKVILTRSNFEVIFTLQHPWQRTLNRARPEAIFTMTKGNYRVYASIGLSYSLMRRMLTILDTGAGPNLIREDELDGDLTDLVKKKSTPELYDANKNPLEVTGTIDLTVQLGTRTLVAPFLVVPKLAVPALLCADFCDEHVETIRPRRRIVELDDGTTIPIVRRRFNNSLRDESSTYAKLPEIRPNRRGNKQNVLRSTTNVWIPPNSQRGIEVKTTGHGLMTIESIQRQHSQHQLAVANGIIYVEPTRKTTILVSNFRIAHGASRKAKVWPALSTAPTTQSKFESV